MRTRSASLLAVAALAGTLLATPPSVAQAKVAAPPWTRVLSPSDLPAGWQSASGAPTVSPSQLSCLRSHPSSAARVTLRDSNTGAEITEMLYSSPRVAAQITAALGRCPSVSHGKGSDTSKGTIVKTTFSPIGGRWVSVYRLPVGGTPGGDTAKGLVMATATSTTTAYFAETGGRHANEPLGQVRRFVRDALVKISGQRSPDARPGALSNGQAGRVTGTNGTEETVQLVRVVDPARAGDSHAGPPAGHRLVGLELKVSDDGPTSIRPEPMSHLTLSDNVGHSFRPTQLALAGCPSFLRSVTLRRGEFVNGCVTFVVLGLSALSRAVYSPDAGGTITWTRGLGRALQSGH